MFNFAIGQLVYYILDNKVHSASILSRILVENSDLAESSSTKEQKEFYMRFGPARVMYSTCHGVFNQDELFGSPVDLAADLFKNVS